MGTESTTTTQRVLPTVARSTTTSTIVYTGPISSSIPNTNTSNINANNTATATATATTMTTTDNRNQLQSSHEMFDQVMENTDILQVILEFVGRKQYLFVSAINRSFRDAYSKMFCNDSRTLPNASTIEFAKFCFDLENEESFSAVFVSVLSLCFRRKI